MSKKHDDPRGKQKGAQQHAEGQHGDKTQSRLREELQSEGRGRDDDGGADRLHPPEGGARLMEDREQRDEAERNSEKTRLSRDIERHDHDRSEHQVVGGTAAHPALPGDIRDTAMPDRAS